MAKYNLTVGYVQQVNLPPNAKPSRMSDFPYFRARIMNAWCGHAHVSAAAAAKCLAKGLSF